MSTIQTDHSPLASVPMEIGEAEPPKKAATTFEHYCERVKQIFAHALATCKKTFDEWLPLVSGPAVIIMAFFRPVEVIIGFGIGTLLSDEDRPKSLEQYFKEGIIKEARHCSWIIVAFVGMATFFNLSSGGIATGIVSSFFLTEWMTERACRQELAKKIAQKEVEKNMAAVSINNVNFPSLAASSLSTLSASSASAMS